ncbi:hypothetical protein [Bartonella sp. HY406]|uniref:hypothetical protein n=1 Tax=Bartonella sp. HY406 TaxID=2979331 RepID=UPI0021C6A19B|nr:hypothetical protein [Bartonella sp. HY406]UXN02747.1 hypothetical protein N6B01_09725 [Bartonella sp. HY406]
MQNHIEFSCQNIHIDHSNDNVRFAASDNDLDPKQYLIIDIITNPTSQDLQLGMDGYYIEIHSQILEQLKLIETQLGQYGAIASIGLTNTDLRIDFDKASRIGKQVDFVKLHFPEYEKANIQHFFKTYLDDLFNDAI